MRLNYRTVFVILILFILIPRTLPAQFEERVEVTEVTRVSHPAYRAGNIWYSLRVPWNSDFSRLLMYESPYKHPDYGTTGRGLVWGYVSELKSWTTLQEYEQAAKPLPQNAYWKNTSIYWSPFPGEENILYGVFKKNQTVSKLNVDTGDITTIISYDPGDGTNVDKARCMGWTRDNHLIVNFDGETGAGFEIDVKNKTRNRFSSWPAECSSEGVRFPDRGHGHSSRSPDGSKIARSYGYSFQNGVTFTADDSFVEDMEYENRESAPYPYQTSYSSWKASENWFLVSSGQSKAGERESWLTEPGIVDYVMWQVFFDGTKFTYFELLKQNTASRWDPDSDHSNDNEIRNYHTHFIPVLRKDGKQIFYTSTEGTYSYDDYSERGKTPWGFAGFFLADLEYSNIEPDNESPDAVILEVDSVTHNRAVIHWNESHDNTRVAGYRVYRDNNLVHEGTETRYADEGLYPSTTYTYTVTAFDPSQNESEASNSVVVTTHELNIEVAYFAKKISEDSDQPQVDGNLNEFKNANIIQIIPATGGNELTVKAIWNSEALFIGYQVSDEHLNASKTGHDVNIWNEDAVEWFVDTQNNGGGGDNPHKPFMLPDDYHGIVNILNSRYDSQGTSSGSSTSSWNGSWQSKVRYRGTVNDNNDIDEGYNIEVRIPWSEIGFSNAPDDDRIITVSFALDDKEDESSSYIYLMWPDITTSFENASKWLPIKLSKELVKIKDSTPPVAPQGLTISTN